MVLALRARHVFQHLLHPPGLAVAPQQPQEDLNRAYHLISGSKSSGATKTGGIKLNVITCYNSYIVHINIL